jgi:hypothetical protein
MAPSLERRIDALEALPISRTPTAAQSMTPEEAYAAMLNGPSRPMPLDSGLTAQEAYMRMLRGWQS